MIPHLWIFNDKQFFEVCFSCFIAGGLFFKWLFRKREEKPVLKKLTGGSEPDQSALMFQPPQSLHSQPAQMIQGQQPEQPNFLQRIFGYTAVTQDRNQSLEQAETFCPNTGRLTGRNTRIEYKKGG